MRKCSKCGKKTRTGRNRSHAQNRSSRTFKANIQKVTLMVGEKKIGGVFCTKCIKKFKTKKSKVERKAKVKTVRKQESKKVESKKDKNKINKKKKVEGKAKMRVSKKKEKKKIKSKVKIR